MSQFLWIPSRGIDAQALERLRLHFRRPLEAMGEAWFMGDERRMFPELLGDLDKICTCDLQEALEEIASGTSAFGPLEEWNSWYHYLLAALLPRCHEEYVEYTLEHLITGFMAIYPAGITDAPYPMFSVDVLTTLGRAMMDAECWSGDEIAVGKVLHQSNNNPARVWCWWDVCGYLSSSMFFCLKYLPQAAVADWMESVLAIPSPHWRAQLIVWLTGVHEYLHKPRWPSEFKSNARPEISWAWSHCLAPKLVQPDRSILLDGSGAPTAFLSKAACETVLAVVRRHFNEDVYLDWLFSIAKVPYLVEEMAEIPDTFERLYLKSD